MPIVQGSRLGPYEVLSPLGAGGMGEVYKAKDTRLNRTVAIKVLPAHLSSNSQFKQRFEREARAVSNLNHPNICVLHDIGHENGIEYLVMEYIEGETLASRLQKGPIPTAQLLQYAIQIADALEKAHRTGIVHRDLKPGNIMLTKGGIKLLDFGLAIQKSTDVESSIVATQSGPITAEGTIVGTIPYMAPEQLEGKEADARSDIWAFGTVLYEMATGKRAFHGKSHASLVAAIMSSEPPPIREVQSLTSPALDQVVKICLLKDPDDRFQSAHDIKLQLLGISEAATQVSSITIAQKRNLKWMYAFLLLPAILLGWLISNRSQNSGTIMHAAIPMPEGTHLSGWGSPVVAVSPDGKKVAFLAEKEDEPQQLYIRFLDQSEPQLVPESRQAEGPFFSPDSQWVGFAVGVSTQSGIKRELKKYSLKTKLTQSICDISDYFGGTWREDGLIVFSDSPSLGLKRVSAAGGTAETILEKTGFMWPQFLPDGHKVLLSNNEKVMVLNLDNKALTDLKITSSYARYVQSGHLIFQQSDGTLMGVRFDPDSLQIKDATSTLMKNVCISGAFAGVFDVSNNGTLVFNTGYLAKSGRELVSILQIKRDGEISTLPITPDIFGRQLAVSPDKSRLITAKWDGTMWVYDLERNTKMKFPTANLWWVELPKWRPDGSMIAFIGTSPDEPTNWNLYIQSADGSGTAKKILTGPEERILHSWTPDGKLLLYSEYDKDGVANLRLVEVKTGKITKEIANGASTASISSDMKWIAYSGGESEKNEVYVLSLTDQTGKIIISPDGGTNPKWSADNKRLYYKNGDRFMMVEVSTESGFRASIPQFLFEVKNVNSFDFLPSTEEFFALQRHPSGIQTHVKFITNWSQELQRRLD